MKITRWSLMAIFVLLLVACVAPAAPSGDSSSDSGADSSGEEAAAGDRSVTFVSWGGAYQEAQTNAYLDAYTEETSVEIVQDGPTDYAKIIAMVEGLANEYRVGSILYATVLGYNTEEYADAPQGWADFFDPEGFPGTRSLPNRASRYIFEVALIADGVDPSELYPLDVERAISVLDRVKEDAIFWETGSQSAQQLADGEASMGMIWNGRIQTAIDEGASLAIQWNQHVALPDFYAVPKGAPNKDEAMQLIAYMVSAEHNHKISDYISYAPVNVETFDKVNEEMASLLPTYEDRPSQGFIVDDAWWDENRDDMIEAYNAWMLE